MRSILLAAFILGAVFMTPLTARAGVLFAGGEESDFIFDGTTPDVVTTSGYFDTNFARLALGPADNVYMKTQPFTPTTTFWTHFRHHGEAGGDTGVDWIAFFDGNGTRRLYIEIDDGGYATKVHLYKIDAAATATLLATSTKEITVYRLRTFDVFIDYSATGTFSLYQDGQLIVEYSGDVTTDGQTTLAQIGFTKADTYSIYESLYSEVIVTTEETRNARLATIEPTGNGATMDWTGAATDIDETGLNHSDAISSATTGQIAQFTIPALPAGNFSVMAVVQNAWVRRAATGPQNVQFLVRTGATDYTSADVTLDTAYGFHSYIWDTNPGTASDWTTSELGAAGFNLGFKSTN